MNITDRTTAAAIIAALPANAPKAVTEAWQQTQRLSAAAGQLGAGPDALSNAVMAALEADRDPAADTEVQRLLALAAIANPGITQAITTTAFARFGQVCREHADAIVKAWTVPFTAAASTLADAHRNLGAVDLADSDTIIRRGGAAVDVWTQAQGAVATIDAISGGWSSLGELTGLGGGDRRYRVLRLASATFGQWQTLELEQRKVTPWEVVTLGLTLSLPNFTQYRQRVGVIQQGAQQEAADHADAQLRYQTGRPQRDRAAAIG